MAALLQRFFAPVWNPLAYLGVSDVIETPEQLVPTAESVLKRLETLLFQQPLTTVRTGGRRSVFKGHGLDFTDLRQYMPGDDIRKMDWKVFARTLVPHVRQYHEERQLIIWVAADLSPSMFFGGGFSGVDGHDASEEAAGCNEGSSFFPARIRQLVDLAALIGILAKQGQSPVGLYAFSGCRSEILKPGQGQGHLHRLVQTLLDMAREEIEACLHAESCNLTTDNAFARHMSEVRRLTGKQAVVFLLSDFIQYAPGWDVPLGELSRKSRLFSVMLEDAMDARLPQGGAVLSLFEPELGRVLTVDCSETVVHQQVQMAWEERQGWMGHHLLNFGSVVRAASSAEPMAVLSALLKSGQAVASVVQDKRS